MSERSAELASASFFSQTAKELVVVGDPTNGNVQLYYSTDGRFYFELKVRGWEGDAIHYVLVVDDPSLGLTLERLVRDGNSIDYCGERYRLWGKTTDLASVTVVPLPL